MGTCVTRLVVELLPNSVLSSSMTSPTLNTLDPNCDLLTNYAVRYQALGIEEIKFR